MINLSQDQLIDAVQDRDARVSKRPLLRIIKSKPGATENRFKVAIKLQSNENVERRLRNLVGSTVADLNEEEMVFMPSYSA